VTRGYVTLVFLFLWSFIASGRLARFNALLECPGGHGVPRNQPDALGKGDRPHVTGTYDSNDIAFVMVCGFPLGAIWFLRGRGFARYIAGLISALTVVAVLLTRSRAVWSACAS